MEKWTGKKWTNNKWRNEQVKNEQITNEEIKKRTDNKRTNGQVTNERMNNWTIVQINKRTDEQMNLGRKKDFSDYLLKGFSYISRGFLTWGGCVSSLDIKGVIIDFLRVFKIQLIQGLLLFLFPSHPPSCESKNYLLKFLFAVNGRAPWMSWLKPNQTLISFLR